MAASRDLEVELRKYDKLKQEKKYHEILGVSENADISEISQAYEKLKRKFPSPKESAKVKKMGKIYEIDEYASEILEIINFAYNALLKKHAPQQSVTNNPSHMYDLHRQVDKVSYELQPKLIACVSSAEQIQVLKKADLSLLKQTQRGQNHLKELFSTLFPNAQLGFMELLGGINQLKATIDATKTAQDSESHTSYILSDIYSKLSTALKSRIIDELNDDKCMQEMFVSAQGHRHDPHLILAMCTYTVRVDANVYARFNSNWIANAEKEVSESKITPKEIASKIINKFKDKNAYLGAYLITVPEGYRSSQVHDAFLMTLELIDKDYLRSMVKSDADVRAIIDNIEYGYSNEEPCPPDAKRLLLEKLGIQHEPAATAVKPGIR